ncbi:MAG: hypothetical protein C4K47_02515 [Candidatus Thorarchaeota archaeon]|nr:MAG: hypothetical protein C4K47_02515 [Candidatus Thorarchaeota archaeon]
MSDITEVLVTRRTGELRELFQHSLDTGLLPEFVNSLSIISQGPMRQRWGILRSILFEVLCIADLQGLDRDPVDIINRVGKLEGRPISSSARPFAIELLREQVARYNTFFLDIDALQKSLGAVLVPQIIEARLAEVKHMCRGRVSSSALISTYYGFTFATSAVRQEEWSAGLHSFLGELGILGDDISCTMEYDFDPELVSFSNASDQTAELLKTILVLTGPNSGKRAEAAERLGCIADPRSEYYLRKVAGDQYPWVRLSAIRALTEIALPPSVLTFIHALGDLDSSVRSEAVKGLVAVGPPAVAPLISILSKEPNIDYADTLRAAEVAHPRSLDNLAAALTQRFNITKALAAEALGKIGDDRAVPSLLQLGRGQDEQLRSIALNALNTFGKS